MPSKPMTTRFVFCAAIYCSILIPAFANPPVPKAGPPPQPNVVRLVALVVDALWTRGSTSRWIDSWAGPARAEGNPFALDDSMLSPFDPATFQKEGCTLDPYGNPIPPCKR